MVLFFFVFLEERKNEIRENYKKKKKKIIMSVLCHIINYYLQSLDPKYLVYHLRNNFLHRHNIHFLDRYHFVLLPDDGVPSCEQYLLQRQHSAADFSPTSSLASKDDATDP